MGGAGGRGRARRHRARADVGEERLARIRLRAGFLRPPAPLHGARDGQRPGLDRADHHRIALPRAARRGMVLGEQARTAGRRARRGRTAGLARRRRPGGRPRGAVGSRRGAEIVLALGRFPLRAARLRHGRFTPAALRLDRRRRRARAARRAHRRAPGRGRPRPAPRHGPRGAHRPHRRGSRRRRPPRDPHALPGRVRHPAPGGGPGQCRRRPGLLRPCHGSHRQAR